MSALNGIKTCVLGLDFQCDITRILGEPLEDTNDLSAAIETIWKRKGLLELLAGTPLDGIINHTDLSTLDYIAETAGLVTLVRAIGTADRREFKLKEFIRDQLEPHYELIVIDCPPSWSHLITNALVACDILVSPLECKVSQLNSLPVFMDVSQLLGNTTQKLTHVQHETSQTSGLRSNRGTSRSSSEQRHSRALRNVDELRCIFDTQPSRLTV